MKNDDTRAAHIQEFIGKYESKNPISRFLISNFYKEITDLLPDDIQSVLEVGCGPGISTRKISGCLNNVKYEASDLSPDLIELARELNPDIPLRTESVYELDREPESVDLVIGLEMLEHLDNPDDALREMLRVSKKYILVSVPREPLWRALNMIRGSYIGDLGNTPGHLNHWSKNKFCQFLKTQCDIIKIASPIPWTVALGKKR